MGKFACTKCGGKVDHIFLKCQEDVMFDLSPDDLAKLAEGWHEREIERTQDMLAHAEKCALEENPSGGPKSANYTIDGEPWDEWGNNEMAFIDSFKHNKEAWVDDARHLRIIFTCDPHLFPVLSDTYCGGGTKHCHYTRCESECGEPSEDCWVHSKDSDLYHLQDDLDLQDRPIEMQFAAENFISALKSHSDLLLRKRNFSFYFKPHHSLRPSGWCTACTMYRREEHRCLLYTERDELNSVCACGCPKSLHYFDPEWDEFLPSAPKYRAPRQMQYARLVGSLWA